MSITMTLPSQNAVASRRDLPELAFTGGAAIYLLMMAIAFLIARPTPQLYFADYWEHRAFVSEVVRHGTALSDPVYGEAGVTSRQFTPWTLALGYTARITGAHVDRVLEWGAMLVSLLFLIGVRMFGRSFFAHRWGPAVLLAALTCAWGVPSIIWTGFHSLRSQIHSNYYPASLVLALSLIAWALATRLIRDERPSAAHALILAAIVPIALLSHPLNAAFLIAGVLGLALFDPGAALQRRAMLAAVTIAGAAAAMLWPYFNPLALAEGGMVRGQSTFNNFTFFFDPIYVPMMIGPALIGLLTVPGLLRQPRGRLLVIAFVGIFAAYLIGYLADVSVSHRLLAYVILALQLMLVRTLLDHIDGERTLFDRLLPEARTAAAVAAAALLLTHLALTAEQMWDPWARTQHDYPAAPVDEEVRRARALLPDNARLMGWNNAALVMPAYGIKVVAFPRPMVTSPTDDARQRDYQRFFHEGVSTAERRAIAKRWGATHVGWLSIDRPGRIGRELLELGPVMKPAGYWRIIKLDQLPSGKRSNP